MSNKTRLQTNNTNLQALIDKANSLPDAGGSGDGSVETITITESSLPEPGSSIYYINGTMAVQQAAVSNNAQYTIVKGTIFIVTSYGGSVFGGCPSICGNNMCKAFYAQSINGGMTGGSDN